MIRFIVAISDMSPLVGGENRTYLVSGEQDSDGYISTIEALEKHCRYLVEMDYIDEEDAEAMVARARMIYFETKSMEDVVKWIEGCDMIVSEPMMIETLI